MSSSDAAIRIYRPGSRIGFVILNPGFEAVIDGISHGSLRPKQVRTIVVTPGPHEVQVRTLGYRLGRKRSVSVPPGETVSLVLPHEWVISLTGLIRLKDATDGDLRTIEALPGTTPDPDDRGTPD
jgi:hypothetical protein